MTIRSAITIAGAGMAAILSLGSAQATSTPHMGGQSARAGTASDANMRAEYRQPRTGMWQDPYDMAPTGDWRMRDDYDRDRADRPDRQR